MENLKSIIQTEIDKTIVYISGLREKIKSLTEKGEIKLLLSYSTKTIQVSENPFVYTNLELFQIKKEIEITIKDIEQKEKELDLYKSFLESLDNKTFYENILSNINKYFPNE